MTAYAIANIQSVNMGPAIVEYLKRIDATLAPYSGRYVIHGGPKQELEGTWPGDVIMIAFPDLATATAWYGSEAYAAIKNLRTDNSSGDVILIEGVPEDHRATDILADAAQ